MNILDGEKNIPYRLFREHCQQTSNGFIKNLSKLGRNIKDVIIIDNSPISYSKHVTNSLPILSWYDDMNDVELLNYLPILEMLVKSSDVRSVIPKIVKDDRISYAQFYKLFNDEKAHVKEILRNFPPQSAQNKKAKKIEYPEYVQPSYNPNEAMNDEQKKCIKKALPSPVINLSLIHI